MRPHAPIAERYSDDTEKRDFVHELFNKGARHYDRIGAIGFLGTGHIHRKRELLKGGLRPGMNVLDVACGTGAVTKAIVEILEDKGRARGVDPSEGMLAEARQSVKAEFCLGHAEGLPFQDREFDFLSMGYALRHVSDLERAFAEYFRVLKPGGTVLILEISRPRSSFALWVSKMYFKEFLPRLSRLITGSRDAQEMMAYYWETIEGCVPPEMILSALRAIGFEGVERQVSMGIFSSYRATKPK